MIKKHLKRLVMPKTWPIKRKGIKYITRPSPGKRYDSSLSINVMLRDLLGIVKSTRETKYILKNKEVLVDGKIVRDLKYPVGLMDVITLPKTDENYRVLLTSKGKLSFVKIEKDMSMIKVSKIIGKTKINKKTQLNLIDSRNILVDKDTYKVNDSVLIDLPRQNIKKHLKFEKDAYALLISGKYVGHHGLVEDISGKNLIINLSDGKKVETSKRYAFVVGNKKSEIKMLE